MRTPSLVLALAAFASAAPAAISGVKPLECPSGSILGRVQNVQQYLASAADVQTIIGQFQVSDWQGLAQTAKSGPDNTPGSTRDVVFGPFTLRERLLAIRTKNNSQTQIFDLINGPVQVSPDYAITAYQEDLSLTTLHTPCTVSNDRSQIVWTVDYCTTGNEQNNEDGGQLFVGAHAGALENVRNRLGLAPYQECSK